MDFEVSHIRIYVGKGPQQNNHVISFSPVLVGGRRNNGLPLKWQPDHQPKRGLNMSNLPPLFQIDEDLRSTIIKIAKTAGSSAAAAREHPGTKGWMFSRAKLGQKRFQAAAFNALTEAAVAFKANGVQQTAPPKKKVKKKVKKKAKKKAKKRTSSKRKTRAAVTPALQALAKSLNITTKSRQWKTDLHTLQDYYGSMYAIAESVTISSKSLSNWARGVCKPTFASKVILAEAARACKAPKVTHKGKKQSVASYLEDVRAAATTTTDKPKPESIVRQQLRLLKGIDGKLDGEDRALLKSIDAKLTTLLSIFE